MNTLSIQLITDLPTYNDYDLKILIGRLTLNMYGREVSDECADFVITERKRREAIAGART